MAMSKAFIVPAIMVAVLAAFPAAAASEPKVKVEVCHANDDGGFHSIGVAAPALPAHLAHGDGVIGEPVPGMEGYVFAEGCELQEEEPTVPIEPGCYDSETDQIDLEYLGPADAVGNARFWWSDDGSCSNLVAFSGVAILTAEDLAEATTRCTAIGLEVVTDPLNGATWGYAGLPATTWLCIP
jgi:hypothetical protein